MNKFRKAGIISYRPELKAKFKINPTLLDSILQD
jgi:hypothetical protein